MILDLKDLKPAERQNYLQYAIAPRPVCFASTIDNLTGTPRNLGIATGSGAISLNNAVGSGVNGAIGALSIDPRKTARIRG